MQSPAVAAPSPPVSGKRPSASPPGGDAPHAGPLKRHKSHAPPTEQAHQRSNAIEQWRVVKKANLKKSVELDSEKICAISVGTVFTALERRGNRVRCEQGWLSILSQTGNRLLERIAPEQTGNANQKATMPAIEWAWEMTAWEIQHSSGIRSGSTSTSFKQYDLADATKLEDGYQQWQDGTGPSKLTMMASKREYLVNFSAMTQTNMTTNFVRRIQRAGGGVTLGGAKGKCAEAKNDMTPSPSPKVTSVRSTPVRPMLPGAPPPRLSASGKSEQETKASRSLPGAPPPRPSASGKSEQETKASRSPDGPTCDVATKVPLASEAGAATTSSVSGSSSAGANLAWKALQMRRAQEAAAAAAPSKTIPAPGVHSGSVKTNAEKSPLRPETVSPAAWAVAQRDAPVPQKNVQVATANTTAKTGGVGPSAIPPPPAEGNGLPFVTLFQAKGRNLTFWKVALSGWKHALGMKYTAKTTFGREKPISKCMAQAWGEPAAVTTFDSLAAAEEHMFKLVAAKLEKSGYTRQRPSNQKPPDRPFLEIGAVHPCPSCASQLKVPERCEQLQCYKCDYGVVKAAAVWEKAAADAERARQAAELRGSNLAKAQKFATLYGRKRDGGDADRKAAHWCKWGLDCVDPDDATLKAAYAAATARLQVAAAEAAISRALVGTYSDNAEFGPIRTALEDHEPIMRAALTGPVQNLPFAYLGRNGTPQERRAVANDRLQTLLSSAKARYTILKEEHKKVIAEEQRRLAKEAAAQLNYSRCYKCSWPGKPGETCPNCEVALPAKLAKGQSRIDGWAGATDGDYVVEYAKSGRSGCRGCEAECAPHCEARVGRQPDGSPYDNAGDNAFMIPKGALRLGVMKFSESASRVVPQWYCKTSFFDAFPKALKSADELHGYDGLSARDQAWIAEMVRADLASDEEYGVVGGSRPDNFINIAEEISDSSDDEGGAVVEDLTKDEIENIE